MRQSSTRLNQLGASAGVLSALFLIASDIVREVGDLDPYSNSVSIARMFIDNRFQVLVGTYLLLLGVFFLFWFVGYLHRYLSEASGEQDRWVASVALGGGLIAGATLLLMAHFAQASTILKDYGGETETAKALFVLDWNDYLLVEAPALAALVGATTLIGFRSKVFPWWMNWSGALLAAVLIGPFLPGSGVILSFLWLGVLSTLLTVRAIRPPA